MQKKPKDKPKPRNPGRGDPASAGSGSSTELISSFSKEAARKESVVRVVLSSGVVEVYPGVVLACTVIQRHPPGLCLAHPDVFRNPHGAVLRPLEPLFPGQKFLLIPWSTVVKLKHKIPESSIGAFADEEDDTGSDEATSSTETETETEEDYQDRSGGGAAEEERDDSSLMPACSAREYFVARDPWSACRFRRLVEQGLAVEPSREEQPEQRKGKARKKGQKKRKGNNKKRRERRPGPAAGPLRPAGMRALATARRTWEPSLPSVVEEESGGSSELFPSHDRS